MGVMSVPDTENILQRYNIEWLFVLCIMLFVAGIIVAILPKLWKVRENQVVHPDSMMHRVTFSTL